MRIDTLIPFIVPLLFLAIWALTSILNRDAPALAATAGPRAGNGPGTGSSPDRPRRSAGNRIPGQAAPRPASAPLQGRGAGGRIIARGTPAQACLRIVDPGTRSITPAPALQRRRRDRVHRDDRWSGAGAKPAGAVTLGFRSDLGRFSTHARRSIAPGSQRTGGRRQCPGTSTEPGRAGDLPGPLEHGHPVAGLAKDQAARDHAAERPSHRALEYSVPGHGNTGHQQDTLGRQPPDLDWRRHPQNAGLSRQAARDRASERAASAPTGAAPRLCRSGSRHSQTILTARPPQQPPRFRLHHQDRFYPMRRRKVRAVRILAVATEVEQASGRYLAWTERFPRTPMAWHRSTSQGGISTDGVRPILGRTLNHYNT